MRNRPRILVFCCWLIIVLSLTVVRAQDSEPSQETAEPTENVVSLPEETSPPHPTEIIPTETQPPVEVTEIPVTDQPVATETEPPTEQPTDLPPETATDVLRPEPTTVLYLAETFTDLTAPNWLLEGGWHIEANGGQSQLTLNNSSAAANLLTPPLRNVAVEVTFSQTNGAAQLLVRQSTSGYYGAALGTNGRLELTRSGELMTSIDIPAVGQNTARTLRLAAFDDAVSVRVDGIEVVTFVDTAPLPAGSVSLIGLMPNDGISTLSVSAVNVWLDAAEWSLLPAPTFVPTTEPVETQVTPVTTQPEPTQVTSEPEILTPEPPDNGVIVVVPTIIYIDPPTPWSPEATPEVTLEATVEATPEVTPEATPETTPEATIEATAGSSLASEPPVNDNFANALTIGDAPQFFMNSFSENVDTSAATLEVDEPQACADIGATVWYKFVAPYPAYYYVRTQNSDFDSAIAFYTGTDLTTLTSVTCLNNAAYTDDAYELPWLNKDDTVWIQVGGSAGVGGNLSFSAELYGCTYNIAAGDTGTLIDVINDIDAHSGENPSESVSVCMAKNSVYTFNQRMNTNSSIPTAFPNIRSGFTLIGNGATFKPLDSAAPMAFMSSYSVAEVSIYGVNFTGWKYDRYDDAAVVFNGGTLLIQDSCFNGNISGYQSVYVSGVTDVTGNWWGSADGPSGMGSGGGEGVNVILDDDNNPVTTLTYEPFATSPFSYCSPVARVSNNLLSNAQVINTLPFGYTREVQYANYSNNDPDTNCGLTSGHSIWFRYTPPANQTVQIASRDNSTSVMMGVFENTTPGTGPTLLAIYCNMTASPTVEQNFNMIAGIEYYIALSQRPGTDYTLPMRFNLGVSQPRTGTPAIPVLSKPSATVPVNVATLTWRAAANSVNYQVQIARNSTMTQGLQTLSSSETKVTITGLTDGVYFWRVRGQNSNSQFGAYTAVRQFTLDTVPALAPALVAPADQSSGVNRRPVFSWSSSTSATKYEIQISTDASFSTALITQFVTTTRFTPVNPLPLGTYYWRVRSQDAAKNLSVFGPVRVVHIGPMRAPANLRIISPAANPSFQWYAMTGALRYRLEISTVADFSTIHTTFITPNANTLTRQLSSPLPQGQYFWRVSYQLTAGNWTVPGYAWLFVVSPPMPNPTQYSPATGSTITTRSFLLRFYAPNTTDYQIQIDNQSNFSSPELDVMAETSPGYYGDYVVTQPLARGTYYIRARGIHALGAVSTWSTTTSIIFQPSSSPIAPRTVTVQENNSTRMPSVTWTPVAGAQMYHIRFGTFNPPLRIYSTTAVSYFFPTPLPYGVYTFQIRTVDAQGQVSPWHVSTFYVTPDNGQNAPLLNRTGPTVELRWTPKSAFSTDYEFQVSLDRNFGTTPAYFATRSLVVNTPYYVLTDLAEGTWYWRVRVQGTTTWSPVYSFNLVSGD